MTKNFELSEFANIITVSGTNTGINNTAPTNTLSVGGTTYLGGNTTITGFANITTTFQVGTTTTLGGNLIPSYTSYVANGFSVVAANLGVISANITANASLGNYQYGTANAAFTITAPSTDCAIDILLTNGSGAGTITLSGFTANATNAGDTYATTSTNKYILMIRRINAVSTYIWKSLQ